MKVEIQSKLCVESSLFPTKFILFVPNAVEMLQGALLFQVLITDFGFILSFSFKKQVPGFTAP
jgi:hypothetical protein